MRTRTTETKKEPLLKPDLYRFEEEYYREGKTLIAGCDEAGRGPLAGPVVAAAVILPPRAEIPSLNDSKKLTEKKRLALEPIIKETALYWAVARVEHDEIDEINILEASLKAMSLALDGLGVAFDVAFIDGPYVTRRGDICQRAIVKGDALSASVAAASVLAKTERDRVMIAYDAVYPGYGFARHKGYPTKAHREAVLAKGPSPIHRRSFKVR
ncbi:MAG: ribonuclease HII [Bacillota bacterium]|jgi:ribonuclease HII